MPVTGFYIAAAKYSLYYCSFFVNYDEEYVTIEFLMASAVLLLPLVYVEKNGKLAETARMAFLVQIF